MANVRRRLSRLPRLVPRLTRERKHAAADTKWGWGLGLVLFFLLLFFRSFLRREFVSSPPPPSFTQTQTHRRHPRKNSRPEIKVTAAPGGANENVEEWNSVEVSSCRGSSQWINGCVDNRSVFEEEDDSNTREGEGRELVLVFSVPWSAK